MFAFQARHTGQWRLSNRPGSGDPQKRLAEQVPQWITMYSYT